MPLTETIKPSDASKKKATESINSLSKKRSGRIRDSSVENGSRGDDISPPRLGSSKKPLAKKTVSDNSEKRARTPIADKVPKKSVQRAKGSLALNKTIETEEKKKRLFDVEEANLNSLTTIKDNVDGTKAKVDRCKVKQPVKNPVTERRIPSAKKKNWATVVKKKSGSAVKGKEEGEQQPQPQPQPQQQPVDVMPRETKSAEIQPEGVPFSSCSFFEKLQQGVKAYFSSRNSLTDEKSKKKVTNGGIRTGAGVAKGGKEETKARIQEKKINNKIKNLDSDLFYDRPRLKSNSGGQTNNFLNKKPKVLQYVRRKKLYHPKKHNVRVQIPRKRYFYRLFEFRPSPSSTCPVNDRMESIPLPTQSEIQIARMASASPKVSDIHKKRIKKARKKTSDTTEKNDEFSLVCGYLEAVNFILNQQIIAQKFEKEVNRLALNWPIEVTVTPEDVNFLREEKKGISSEMFFFEGNKNPCGEDSLSPNNSATKIKKFDCGFQIESAESYSILESQIRNFTPESKTPEEADPKPDLSFDILMSYLRNSLGDEQRFGALEISPIMMTKEDLESDLINETPPKIESDEKPAGSKNYNFDENLPNSLKKNHCVVTAFSEYKNRNSIKLKKSEEQFAELLIGDIDLHSELQNYLKETKRRKADDTRNISPVVNQNDQSLGLKEKWSERNFDCTPDKDADHVKVPFNPLPEIESMSEEIMKLVTFEHSSTHVTDDMSKTRWEVDSKELAQKSDGYMTNIDKKEKLVSQLATVLFQKHNEQLGGALERYEKVSPMEATFKTRKSKSKLLRGNSINSVPKEQMLSKIKSTRSKSNQFQKSEDTEANKKIKIEENADVNQSRNDRNWCRTFEELTDMYSSILKHNSKAKNSKRLKNLESSSILSILKDKLEKKQKQVDLINFAKTLKEYFKPPSDWKSGADTDKHKKLQEYVNTFQEILTSSLSIEQITYLNNIISQLQDKEASTQSCDNKNDQESIKSISDDETESENETPNPPVPQEKTKEQVPKPAKNNTSVSVLSKRYSKEKSASLKKIKPVENPQKVALSPPAELEKVLKSTFNSENIRKRTKTVDKILVNVKVCGSRVLVNDFSYIHDEKSLYPRPPTRNKVSELIIENITSDHSTKASLSELSLTPLTSKKSSKRIVKKSQNIKIVLKSTKADRRKSEQKLKIRHDDSDKKSENSEEKDTDKLKTLKPVGECKNVNPMETVFPNESLPRNTFEYNQELLKAQHPIDAIIETSESKIMEVVESAENIDPNEKPATETKSSKRLEATEVKKAPNKTVVERRFLKDLINDLGWSNDVVRKDLVRTRSHDLNGNRDENFILREASTNEIKFLDDSQLKLGNVGKKSRKVPVRQHNAYFCYPSVVHQDKSVELKKKSSKENNLKAAKKMNAKAVKKTESRIVKTSILKGTKETDLKMVKPSTKSVKKTDSRVIKVASLKALKKTDSKVVKTANSKETKQTDLNVIKTANPKPVPKKNVKENMKRSDTLPTFSRQIAASERLAKRPERFSKPNRLPPKQKENNVQSGKASLNIIPNTDACKNSEHSLLYMKEKTDFGSEASSVNDSTASCYFEEVLKQKQKPHSGNSAKSTSSSETAETIDKYKTSPIVIFSTLGDSDGVTSQFAMIHSDSVLKTLSRSPISPTKIESVFKSHSDLKFYPGRISDSMEEQRPWVKFILTPQQEANADLPAHQIKVVDKRHQAEIDSKDEDNENTQIPFNSLEKFIDELRDGRLKVLRRKELEKRKNERKKASSSAMIKQKIRWSPCDVSNNPAIKKQDCQKNKMKIRFSEGRRRGDKKNSGKETILAKVIVSIFQFLLEQRVKEIGNVKQFGKNFESENLQADPDDDVSGEGAVEKWRKLEKTTNEMLNAIVNGVTKFEKLVKKKKLIVAIKAELKKMEADLGANFSGLLELSKRVDTLKTLKRVKIETPRNEIEREAENQEMPFPRTSEDMKLVESLLTTENEVGDLRRKPSTYFDAEEKDKGENEGCSNRFQFQSGDTFANTAMLALLGESTTEIKGGEEAYPKVPLTPSDENLLSAKTINLNTEEIVFCKLHESLEENNVSYSMALFDFFLKKKGILGREEKLQNFLQTVNKKSKNLMRELEKSAWIKLLFLLEEVSKMYDIQAEKSITESMYRYVTNQLNKPLAYIGSIQIINEKMGNLQNFLSQSKVCSDFHLYKVFSRFLTRVTQMKNTVVPRLTCSVMRFSEDESSENSSGYEIRAVKAAHNFYNTSDGPEKKIRLQFLKNQIKDQRLFIEYLINTDLGSSSSEISDVKNRVSEKLRVLEKSLSNMAEDEDVRNTSTESLLETMANSVSLSQISSFLTWTRACRNVGITEQNTWNVEECK